MIGLRARRRSCGPAEPTAGTGCERQDGVKRAIISDIHSNLEGLEAVLADIDQQGITEIYCLGDIIGYGPNPASASTW